jgi:hypothetical protein
MRLQASRCPKRRPSAGTKQAAPDRNVDIRGKFWLAILGGLAPEVGPAFADVKADGVKRVAKLKPIKTPTAKQKNAL